MNEKVKLPKNVIDTFRPSPNNPCYRPISVISDMYNRILEGMTSDVVAWLNDYNNQWKLIDALRYGYEAEPEPRWGIKAGNCYMDAPDSWGFDNVTPKAVIDNDAYWTIKKAADEIVRVLGFGEVVDLNKEVEADD